MTKHPWNVTCSRHKRDSVRDLQIAALISALVNDDAGVLGAGTSVGLMEFTMAHAGVRLLLWSKGSLCMSMQMHCNTNYAQGQRKVIVHCSSTESH